MGAITLVVLLLLSTGFIATPAAAVTGTVGGGSSRAMAIESFVVDSNERGVVAGGSAQGVIGFGGTTNGVDTTLELVPTNVTEGLVLAPINCGDCTSSDPVTFVYGGASPSYSGTLTFDVTVPADAAVGETFTLGITATESSSVGVDSSYGEVVFTIVAPATEMPAPTEPSLPTEPPAPIQTLPPVPPTQTPIPITPAATETFEPDAPTVTPTADVIPDTPIATATSTPDDASNANVRARITSADPVEANEIPGGSVLLIRQGATDVYTVVIGADGAPTSLPIGGPQGVNLTTSQVPVDFPYGVYTVSFDAGAVFEPFVQDISLDQPLETIDIVLIPELGDGESLVDLRIVSSDPDLVDAMGVDTNVRLTQGDRVVYDGALTTTNLLPLPRTLSFTNPIDFGVYTLTIEAGEAFEVYTAQVVIDESPEQLVEIELRALTLTERLVGVLKPTIEQVLSGD